MKRPAVSGVLDRLKCFVGSHGNRITVRRFEADDIAVELDLCSRCRRQLAERKLSPAEVCGFVHHDFESFRDSISAVSRDTSTGELVALTLRRVSTCSRCGETRDGPVPPESVPADIFERVELGLRDRIEKSAVEGFEIDLSERGKG